jgi:hypothetical protein
MMKNIKNKYLITAMAVLLLLSVISSCKKDFYEIEDPNGFEVEGSFEDAGAVGLFLNRTYSLVIPQWPLLTTTNIHITSDEYNSGNTGFLYGTLVENSVTDIATGTGITANRYADIRRCNLALEGLNTSKTIAAIEIAQLKGQFYFLRALAYSRLVRLYGGVPLVLRAQTLEEESLQVPRSKTSECIAAIARDLDSATALLPATWPTTTDVNRITRAAASALKGRVMLMWASPQFNISNDAQRWTAAYTACKAAFDLCTTDGYVLLPNYANVLSTEDHKENLIVRKYSLSRDLGHNLESINRPVTEANGGGGQFQPTWNIVQSYLMNNGLPITHASSGYNATQFWQNRDPRFNASIAYNGDSWALSGIAGRKQWQYNSVLNNNTVESNVNTGFYCKRLSIPSISFAATPYNSNVGGGNGMDWVEMRFAEVLTNLAECANETGNINEAKDMIRRLRIRAGIVAGTFDYGLSIATDASSMRSLILNERQIEFAFEGGMRYHDLRRTRNLNLITARQSYKVGLKLPYTAGAIPLVGGVPTPVPGRIYMDVTNFNGQLLRDTVNINNAASYNTVFQLPATIASLEGSNAVSIPSRYYVYALPNLLSQSPGIEQTNGWAGGSFDPFQ